MLLFTKIMKNYFLKNFVKKEYFVTQKIHLIW